MTISCSSADIVPKECHNIGAKSGTTSRFLLSSINACSLVSGFPSLRIQVYTCIDKLVTKYDILIDQNVANVMHYHCSTFCCRHVRNMIITLCVLSVAVPLPGRPQTSASQVKLIYCTFMPSEIKSNYRANDVTVL